MGKKKGAHSEKLSKEVTYAVLRRDVENDPLDAKAKAVLGLFAFTEDGPSLNAVLLAFEQQTPPASEDVKRLHVMLLRQIEQGFKLDISRLIGTLPSPSRDASAEPYLEYRNTVLQAYREQGFSLIWDRALELVAHHPAQALEIFEAGLPEMQQAITVPASYYFSRRHGNDHFYGQIGRGAQAVADMLKDRDGVDIASLSEDEVVALASTQCGGMRLMVAVALTMHLLEASTLCAILILQDSMEDLRGELAEHAYDRHVTGLRAVATLPVWGEYQPLLLILSKQPLENWDGLLMGLVAANKMAALVYENASAREKLSRQEASQAKKERNRLTHRLSEVEGLLAKTQKTLALQRTTASIAPPVTVTGADPAWIDLQRHVARLEQDLAAKTGQLSDTRGLLDALLADPADQATETLSMTEEDFGGLRGVVIGGHQNLTSKLRKLMPACLFYSADQQRVDEPAVRDRNFIIFFTGYCNHALAGNAMRISRQYDIPCGYTTHVNIAMCLQDIAMIVGRNYTTGGAHRQTTIEAEPAERMD